MPHKGYLEVRESGKWQLVCDPDARSWGLPEAQVVCRELGYEEGGVVEETLEFTPASAGLGARPPFPVRIKCKGDESSLQDCTWQTEENSTMSNGWYVLA